MSEKYIYGIYWPDCTISFLPDFFDEGDDCPVDLTKEARDNSFVIRKFKITEVEY